MTGLWSHLTLSDELEVGEGNGLKSDVVLAPAEERILGNSSALSVGAGGLAAGAGLAWLYNKYQNSNRPSYQSRPSYYNRPSYQSRPTYNGLSHYNRPPYNPIQPVYPATNTIYKPFSRPGYTANTLYRPGTYYDTSSYRPGQATYRPAVIPVPQTSTYRPVVIPQKHQINETHYVLASRKLSNILTGAAAAAGGALLYNKYQDYKNRPSYYNYNYGQRYPYYSHGHGHGYPYQHQLSYSTYRPGSFITKTQTYSNGYRRPNSSIFRGR